MRRMLQLSSAVACALILASAASAGMLEVGADAPGFTLMNQKGEEVSLSDYDGKVVVLEWVNPDCPFVQRHYKADTMTKLASKWAEKDVVWLAINSTKYADVEANAKFAKAEDVDYNILDDHTGTVGRAYQAKTTPHMFIVSPEGKVVYNGAIDDDAKGSKDDARNFVDAALASATAGEAVEYAQTKPYGCSVKYAPKAEETMKSTSR